jgi:hypothetical protein
MNKNRFKKEMMIKPYKHATDFFQTLRHNFRRYPFAYDLYRNALFFTHALREGIWLARLGFSLNKNLSNLRQKVMQWDVAFPVLHTPAEAVSWLRSQGIHLNEGMHTIYVPPQKRLGNLIPSVVDFYPPNSGFKILKDFHPPSEANYVAQHSRSFLQSKLIGTPLDQLITANYMYALGLGPRVWDVCCWKSFGKLYTVFVVEHIHGSSPSRDNWMDFMKRLKQILSKSSLRIVQPRWKWNADFACPHCNHNLVQPNDLGCPRYVDFQTFAMTSSLDWTKEIIAEARGVFHFGAGRPFRGTRYLYQSVPKISRGGKRNTNKRWAFILSQFSKAGIDLRDRVVLDVGCNAGMMLHAALNAGAGWCIGWDRPVVVEYAQNLLLSLGSSRFHLIGGNLHPDYPIEKDVPINLRNSLNESVVFYLSARQHMGLLNSLQKIPWRILVYEGHQRERLDDIPTVLGSFLTSDVHTLTSAKIADGDSGARPIVILQRINNAEPQTKT